VIFIQGKTDNMKRGIVLILVILAISCSTRKNVIDPILLQEIKEYIKISELKENKDSYDETDIYLVKFYDIKNKKYVKLYEINYYKENYDGYINIGDNTVFFYDSNINFVNADLLENKDVKHIPDENSDEVLIGMDSVVWYFSITEEFELKRIHDENFLLDWYGNINK